MNAGNRRDELPFLGYVQNPAQDGEFSIDAAHANAAIQTRELDLSLSPARDFGLSRTLPPFDELCHQRFINFVQSGIPERLECQQEPSPDLIEAYGSGLGCPFNSHPFE